MNENLSPENPSTENKVETPTAIQETLPDSLGETLLQVDKLQEADEQGKNGDAVSAVGERIGATGEQMDAAKRSVNFSERHSAIDERKRSIREKFAASVRKAVVPVATSFLMSPAFSQQEEGGISIEPLEVAQAGIEAAQLITEKAADKKEGKKELAYEDVFDMSSPLAQSGEKQAERKVTPEDLATLKDLHTKAWNETGEWAAFTGKGKNGEHKVKLLEMGARGGYVELLEEDELEPESMTHTHPIMQAGVLGLSGENMRQGKEKPFIMPPSSADLGTCIDASSKIKQRIVDSRGVWEYSCDENHPFVQEKKKMESELVANMRALKQKYKVSDEDMQEAFAAANKAHPSELLQAGLENLEVRYPGIGKGGKDFIASGFSKNAVKFGMSLMSYENKVSALSLDSTKLSDGELGQEIKKFIDYAGTQGMTLRYTPFKEMPKMPQGN